jgi:hypothetical protein
MNRDDFDIFRDGHYNQIAEINHKKGKDYAGDQDALANFKVIGKDLGLDPLKVWGVYASKHWSAVMAYVREGKVESEPIEGRLHDVILYCFLLLGLIEERKIHAKLEAATRRVQEQALNG